MEAADDTMADEQKALAEQQHRCIELRQELRRIGDLQYDPDAALLRQFSAFFPRFTGHSVGQNSLEYALLLLHSDDRTYGSDDAGEANRIIRRILEHQDLAPSSDTFGNFRWMTHWSRVKDHNAVSFLTPGLVYAWLTFPEKLEDETKAALARAFPSLLAGIRGHMVRWQYSNIFFLNLGALEGLSRVLGDPEPHEQAVSVFDEWLAGTDADGLHEFNCPSYTPVSLFGIEAAWAFTDDEQFRARLGRLLDVLTYQFALNLIPNGFPAGAAARAYQHAILHGAGHGSTWAHLKLGTPRIASDEDRVILTNHTLFHYVPPVGVRGLIAGRTAPVEVHDRTISVGSRRTHLVTPSYGLSSQCMERVGGHSPPAYILLARNVDAPRPSVPILPDESFSHQPCAVFGSRQTGGRVVGRLGYECDDEQRAKFLADPTYVCEPRVLFGRGEQIAEVRVGNVDWGGGPMELVAGQSVAVSFGDLFVGIALRLTGDGAARPVLAYGDDDELRLRVPLFGGPDLQPDDEPLGALLLVDVTEPGKSASLREYADWLAAWDLTASEADDLGVLAQHPDEPELAYPYPDSDPDPLGEAIHMSPDLTIRPGDLLALVNGGSMPPVLDP